MLHILLDTSIYRRDPKRNSSPFRALVRLVQGGKVKLYIPEIVKREFTGQQLEAVQKLLREVINSLKKLRGTTADGQLGTFVVDTIDAAKQMVGTAKTVTEAEFSQWLDSIHATEQKIIEKHAINAFESYFKGNPPFKAIKNRNDIPDAFILQAASTIAEQHQPLRFIVEDRGLRAAADLDQRLVTYSKLDDFIQSPAAQDALNEMSADVNRTANRARVLERIPTLHGELVREIESMLPRSLNGKTVEDRRIPDDNNEGMVLSVGDIDDVVFEFDNIEYYGEQDIGIPFSAVAQCTLNYAAYKADYYSLDEEKIDRMSIDERNRHYFDVDEDYALRITGALTLQIDDCDLEQELSDFRSR